ncbi:O-methyltransferase [Lecanosticta acicola]|uniref:O-methyltransferase n=1 Tax=Lecanosticta acicola TaxID=111012 RepID=A0AAI8YSB6_9PEZI|nr:O-methyltransferase [Lecanosticta acicola]
MSTASITDLAKSILENAQKVEDYLKANNLPQPSFDEHSPPELPLSPEMQQIRQNAVDAAMDLEALLIGPVMQLRPVLNGASLNAIYKFDIATKVPLDGQISYEELAPKVGIKRTDLQRIVRFAVVHHHVFQEKTVGMVSHSAASRYLAESDIARAGLGFMFDECYQSFAHTVEAMQKYGDPEPNQCGWALAMKADVPMWEYHGQHPELGERAGKAMASFTKGTGHDSTALTRGYDWTVINAKGGTLVDLGGADGHVDADIARLNPGMQFIVQEIPEVLGKAKSTVPQDVAGRLTFAAHDFFQPQPTSADAYLFRQIFHNWGDRHCVQMLRALIPALRPGAKVIVNDNILPPPGVLPPSAERAVRSIDMIVMSLFNARERSKEDFEAVFAEADPRFQQVKVWTPEGSQMGLVEATWSG